MIAKTQGYSTSDGKLCATLEEAQRQEVELLAISDEKLTGEGKASEEVAAFVMRNVEALIAILAMTPRSKLKARKVAGTTNPKRAARKTASAKEQYDLSLQAASSSVEVPATAAQVADGFAAMRAELA